MARRIGSCGLSLLVTILACAGPSFAESRAGHPRKLQVALTFDDLPSAHGDLAVMRDVTAKLTRGLAAHRIPAAGFVNEYKLIEPGEIDERAALLDRWLEAGADLGNHTYSHVAIDRVPLEKYQDEVIRGETITAKLLERRGQRLRYFRHTQLRTGPTAEYRDALTAWLLARGYTIAPVTIDNNDYLFAAVYADAKRSHDEAMKGRVVDAYVPYLDAVTAHFENVSRGLFGYVVPQIVLLHANELNADHLDKVVSMFVARGYEFISLGDALRDPAYGAEEAVSRRGLSWLHRWALARGAALQPEPEEPAFIRERYEKLTAR